MDCLSGGGSGRRYQFAQRIKHLLELIACVAAERIVIEGQRFDLVFQL